MTSRTITEYNAEIDRRASALIDSGDLDTIVAQMSSIEAERYQQNFRVINACRLASSREHAIREVSAIITAAAKKAAQIQYREEMQLGARQHAIARHYAMTGAHA